MLRYLLRQPLNIWRTLGWLNKSEIIILLGLVYSYLIGRIFHIYSNLLEYDWITPFGLSSLTAHLFIFSLFSSGSFILMYLLPRQKILIPFYTQPLDKWNFFQLTGYLYFKYQLIPLFAALPFISALIGIQWLTAMFSFILLFTYSLILFFLQILLYIKFLNRVVFSAVHFLVLILFYTIYGLQYLLVGYPLVFDVIIILISAVILGYTLKQFPAQQLQILFSPANQMLKKSKIGRIDFNTIPDIFPAKIQVLFKKELIGLWRNPHYRRLKLITLIFFLLFLALIAISQIENKDIWITVFTGAIIWIHYSNHFNEKYVQPEPEWFYKTIPLRFYQTWSSKFLTEILFIGVMLLFFWITLLLMDMDLFAQLNMIGLILIFSVFVLTVMLNFQIMFFDDPRLAGYAYHFTIIFLLIMSLNYRLVGPLISLILLSFYFYKSYKYFNS